jgi:hypothetical protein
VQHATLVYYNQDLTKKRDKDKKKKKHQDFIAVLRELPTRQDPTLGTHYQCRQEGHFCRSVKGGAAWEIAPALSGTMHHI